MKKILLVIILSSIMFTVIGCQYLPNKNGENLVDSKNELENKDNILEVKIIAKDTPAEFSRMPITLTSKLIGEGRNDIQYHWILDNKEQPDLIEAFLSSEGEPLREVTNSSEAIELVLIAKVNWVEGTVEEFKVRLQIEEKNSSNIIAIDEIIIENHAGVYKIK